MSTSAGLADRLLDFLDASPSPFHAVRSARARLEHTGFIQLKERDSWESKLAPGSKYYVTRNDSSIIAFSIGTDWAPGAPAALVCAHTDSPTLRVKPHSKRSKEGYLQVAIERYSGALWHTWFDRDLSLAGRVMTRDGKTSETTIHQHLVKVDRPILRIPTLAYHLDRQQPFDVNLEDHLLPILGPSNDGQNADCSPLPSLQERHHSQLVELLAEETGVDIKDVVNFELIIYDTQKAARGGVKNDLIFSSRLDNLVMSFCAVEGLIQSLASANAESSHAVSLVALFDDEEIGSETPQGAASNFLPCVIQRLCSQFGASPSAYQQTLARSFAISADMAHAVHPNYASKYESGHKPKLNGGVVIKTNAKGMYSSDSAGITLLEEVATRARYSYHCPPGSQGVPLQHFVVRNDSSCGSTIGPLIARSLGVRTIDVGNAQLSMHSIRETTGAHDIENAVNLFDSFFRHYGQLEDMIVAV